MFCFVVLQDFVLYRMIINFVGIKFFVDFLLCFLSMIIYELLGIVFKV